MRSGFNKDLLIKFTPLLIMLLCAAVLSRFFIDPFRYTIQADDTIFLRLLQDHSIWDSSFEVQKVYNGRWFSHLYTCVVFGILKMNWSYYFLYDIFVFLLLVTSVYFFLTSFMKNGIISNVYGARRVLLSFLFSSVLFVFLIDGRYEVFYWISSVSNHLLSIIFFLFTLAVFPGKNPWRYVPLGLLAFCLGQMNEVYIINYLLILFFLQLARPETRIAFIIFVVVISASIYVNITAVGTATRVTRALPEFSLVQASKDVIETFLLPLSTYRYLPLKLGALLLFMFSLSNYFKIVISLKGNFFFLFNRLLLLVSVFGICAQCFLLRLVCPYRSMLAYMLAIMYFLFLIAVKGLKNPLRLFF